MVDNIDKKLEKVDLFVLDYSALMILQNIGFINWLIDFVRNNKKRLRFIMAFLDVMKLFQKAMQKNNKK